jgi:hypothetical protein
MRFLKNSKNLQWPNPATYDQNIDDERLCWFSCHNNLQLLDDDNDAVLMVVGTENGWTATKEDQVVR